MSSLLLGHALAPHLAIIAGTFVALYALFRFISHADALLYPSVKDTTLRLLCASYTVAGLHSLVVSALGVYESLTNPLMWEVRASTSAGYASPLYQYTCCFLIGYMLYDLVAILSTPAIYRQYNHVFLFHHVVAISGSVVPGLRGHYQSLTMPFLLAEIPVVFVNAHSIYSLLLASRGDTGTGGAVHLSLTVLSGASFFLFRICIIPMIGYQAWTFCVVERICPHLYDALTLFFTYSALSALNCYWFASAALAFLRPHTKTH